MTQFTPEPEDPMVYPYRSPEERAAEAQPSEAVPGEPEPTPSQPPADGESDSTDASRPDSSDE